MQALQAAIALSETVSVDSDTSKVMETFTHQRRGRKQAKPSRALDSTEAPAEFQLSAAAKQQQSYLPNEASSGDSPILNNQVGCEDTAVPIKVQQSVSSSKSGSKNSPAHRQGPCGHCKTPYSPQWRKGPRNKPVLCNACGIRYLRNRHLGRSVPQKKRSSMPTAKTAAGDSSEAGEASVDTLTDTTDMRGPFKRRKTKKGDMGDEDTSAYSYDDSGLQETMGSVGSFQQLLLQQHLSYSDTDHTCADADTAARRGSDVSQSDKQNRAGAPASMQADAQAKAAAGPTFSTSLAMPGNMQQQLLAPMQSLASSSGIYGGGYSMALALQLYQQQQHQLLLNQQLLMSQAPTESSGLQTQGSSVAASAPGSPALSSAGLAGSAQQVNLLSGYSQSLQMQQLQGYLLQQQQHAHVLQAAGMLHGPSPLSVMSTGAVSSSLALGGSGQLSALPAAPAPAAVPSLEIAPLVCGEKPVALSTAMPAQAQAAAANPAGAASIQAPAKTGNAVLGSFQSLLAA